MPAKNMKLPSGGVSGEATLIVQIPTDTSRRNDYDSI